MEDLVLIYGCTLVTSWAAVALDDFAMGARVSLASRALKSGGASFAWSNVYGTVECHDSQIDTVGSLPCYVYSPRCVLTFPPPLPSFALLKIENFIRTP